MKLSIKLRGFHNALNKMIRTRIRKKIADSVSLSFGVFIHAFLVIVRKRKEKNFFKEKTNCKENVLYL